MYLYKLQKRANLHSLSSVVSDEEYGGAEHVVCELVQYRAQLQLCVHLSPACRHTALLAQDQQVHAQVSAFHLNVR